MGDQIARGEFAIRGYEIELILYLRTLSNQAREQAYDRLGVEIVVDIKNQKYIPHNVQALTTSVPAQH